ncbi:MAG: sensor domain-containing diguanylate cyclase [Legionellaceae bacterium]|nr:sensor domain-containing diguanylate cyclase [Legionellaceae bacterium]
MNDRDFEIKMEHIHWTLEFIMSDSFLEFLDLIPEAVIVSEESGRIIITNRVAQQLFQYSEDEFRQCMIEDLVPQKIRSMHPKLRAEFFDNPEPRFMAGRNLDLCACKKGGSSFPMESALFSIKTDQGQLAVNLLRDITEQKENEEKINKYAFVDTVTNLPNRRYFDDYIKRAASNARRYNTRLGLLYIDLDLFKPINDTHGHDMGDLVLQEISDRICGALRTEDMLARVGGDEFVLTLSSITNIKHLEILAKRILSVCCQPIHIAEQSLQLSVSIGISFIQARDFDEQALIKSADKAMYQAKKQGGNCFVFAEK